MAAVKVPLAVPQNSANTVFRASNVQRIAAIFDAKFNLGAGLKLAESKLLQASSLVTPTCQSVEPNFYKEMSPIPAHQDSNTFFDPEDEFAKLSVKRKVQLYEQFINGRFKQKAKIVNQAGKYMEKPQVMAEFLNEAEQFELIEQPSKRQTENKDDFNATVQRKPSRKRRNEESRCYLPPTKVKCSRDKRTWSPAVKNSTKQQLNSSETGEIFDSSIDPELETGNYSPIPIINCSTSNNGATVQFESLFPQMIPEAKTFTSRESGNLSYSSTPISGHQHVQSTKSSSHQTLHSPITNPMRSRRRSLFATEPRLSSVGMQVICEDQPVQHQNTSIYPEILDLSAGDHTGQFWIKCPHFNLSFDIFCEDVDQIPDAFNSFRQKIWDNNESCFGIDMVPFYINHQVENICELLPHKKGYSCYWFSATGIIVALTGKRISPDKVQDLFQFLRTSIEDGDVISFGVGNMEFSSVRQFWDESFEFSMDRNYSMLIGLQSGNSNGLEGRSRHAWPNCKPVRENDLPEDEEGVDIFEEMNSILKSIKISSNFGNESLNDFFYED